MTKKRRPKGEGSVYRRKDGRVVGEWVDANGRTRYITSTTMTKAEMRAKLRAILRVFTARPPASASEHLSKLT